ncbi:hypothetical protein [Paraburkholderia guartelaensis]|uniref:hypothetical protein n=1 Tax=Paraburkholderia guartelaensis TaxID=2546446 RepID=UPI002AB6ED76|nr:hypothetical protein [Paraburkholderia guartelaensis]
MALLAAQVIENTPDSLPKRTIYLACVAHPRYNLRLLTCRTGSDARVALIHKE